MNRILSGAGSMIAATMLTAAVAAQTPAPQPAQTPAQPPSTAATSQANQSVKVVGCIQSEADYRKTRDQGKGGVVGTGVGVGNEYVLVNASMATQGLSPSGGPADTAYELTGSGEAKAKEFVGKRVEITGMLKPAETAATGRPTGGATAGTPPTGVDVASKDLKLRELEVTSVTAATGTCTP